MVKTTVALKGASAAGISARNNPIFKTDFSCICSASDLGEASARKVGLTKQLVLKKLDSKKFSIDAIGYPSFIW